MLSKYIQAVRLKRLNSDKVFRVFYCRDACCWTVQILYTDGWLCLH